MAVFAFWTDQSCCNLCISSSSSARSAAQPAFDCKRNSAWLRSCDKVPSRHCSSPAGGLTILTAGLCLSAADLHFCKAKTVSDCACSTVVRNQYRALRNALISCYKNKDRILCCLSSAWVAGFIHACEYLLCCKPFKSKIL